MAYFNSSRRLQSATLHVDGEARPGWISGAERCPTVGEEIYCAEGLAEVVRLHGKISDGSRLVELRLPGVKTPPFFAAASNILVAPNAA
ncbi:hypothetical protein BH20GEM3_BH20GEM3_01500 [soil metagenome]